jgi:superfamily II DNA or RNA helicase
MNVRPINEKVVEHWQRLAGDRRTVVFCSTVAHAHDVQKEFLNAGIPAGAVDGTTPREERADTLKKYASGELQVICNVAVLTEGWDCPPTACVILLRPASYKSTMIQMVGRGLRVVNPIDFPGVIKNDCIVLDFGTSSIAHKTLESGLGLEDREGKDIEC